MKRERNHCKVSGKVTETVQCFLFYVLSLRSETVLFLLEFAIDSTSQYNFWFLGYGTPFDDGIKLSFGKEKNFKRSLRKCFVEIDETN